MNANEPIDLARAYYVVTGGGSVRGGPCSWNIVATFEDRNKAHGYALALRGRSRDNIAVIDRKDAGFVRDGGRCFPTCLAEVT